MTADNKMLTIKRFAELMGVSVHQLRYFEEKGILEPEVTAQNGYRLYGINSIYRLSHILLLRDLGIPVERIKYGFERYSPDDYRHCIDNSVKEIDKEVERLQRIKEGALLAVQQYEDYMEGIPKSSLCNWEEKLLLPLSNETESEQEPPVQILFHLRQFFKKTLYRTDLVYLQEAGQTKVYLLAEDSRIAQLEKTLTLQEGVYFVQNFRANSEKDFKVACNELAAQAKVRNVVLTGPTVFVERSLPSIFSNEGLCVQVARKVADQA